ncbi:MAG: response regulator [Phascolarctobacterium sp.]|nr:response regulator [Phascolarctobacterium sp.]
MQAIDQFKTIYDLDVSNRKRWEILFFFICIETVLAFSYLGFILIPPVAITTMHYMVIVAAICFGPLEAGIVGLCFALASMWKATVTATAWGDQIFSPFISGSPLASFVLCVVTRIAFGIIAGYLFRLIMPKFVGKKSEYLCVAVLTLIVTQIHTLLVFGAMIYFFGFESSTLFADPSLSLAATPFVVCFFHWLLKSNFCKDLFNTIGHYDKHIEEDVCKTFAMPFALCIVIFLLIYIHLDGRFLEIVARFEIVSPALDDFIHSTRQIIFWQLISISATLLGSFVAFNWHRQYSSAQATKRRLAVEQEARYAAETASRAKTSFLLSMSHDIRTPMNAIVGFTKLLQDHGDDAELRAKYLKNIESSSVQLLGLINNVLETARIENGKIELDLGPYNCIDSIKEVEAMFSSSVKEKNLSWSLTTDIKHPYVINDNVKFSEIVINIISNAVKYTPAGGKISVNITELPTENDDYVTHKIVVEDTGVGMSEDFLPHVFDDFSREYSTTDSKIIGTGLGLSITKRLVEFMGGSINIESELNKGTKVTVTCPFQVTELPDKDDITESVETISFAGKRILLAEDNELNAEIAVAILEEAGFKIEVADNGIECIDMLRKHDVNYYDVILMDIQMPEMDGLTATTKIRRLKDDARRDIPIIAMTANAFEEDKQKALAAGMNGFVIKPIDIPALMQALKEIIK